jgi:hypothetical protein
MCTFMGLLNWTSRWAFGLVIWSTRVINMLPIAQDSIHRLPASSSRILCSVAGSCALLLFFSSSALGILASVPLVKLLSALPPSLSACSWCPFPPSRQVPPLPFLIWPGSHYQWTTTNKFNVYMVLVGRYCYIILPPYLNCCHHWLFGLCLTIRLIQNINSNIQNYKSYFKS